MVFLDAVETVENVGEVSCWDAFAVVDYFYGSNTFASSEILWRRYFDHFGYAARKDY